MKILPQQFCGSLLMLSSLDVEDISSRSLCPNPTARGAGGKEDVGEAEGGLKWRTVNERMDDKRSDLMRINW